MSEVIFLIDLTQDVAASRPIARFARAEFGAPVTFIVTDTFRNRDATGLWYDELREIEAELPATLVSVSGVAQGVRALAGRSGVLISCSESALDAHGFNHGVFLAAPPDLTRVTLQHGLECIGFNHNAAHDRTWQHYIGMACDVAGSWFHADALHSVRPDQRSKVEALGPPFGLETAMPTRATRPRRLERATLHGLVCENLHSVRFGSSAKVAFVDALARFAAALDTDGGTLELRPHPGGRYAERQGLALPPNVRLNRLPLYKQALDRFAFGISSPSSVVLDMVWAGIPVAVWNGGDPSLDIGVYNGLHVVSTEADWVDFARSALAEPEAYLLRQDDYLASLPIPPDIPGRYRGLLAATIGAGVGRCPAPWSLEISSAGAT